MPVSMRWLGNAGFTFRARQTTLMVDPYFTRPSFARLFSGRVHSDLNALEQYGCACDALLISHAHFDHCLDAPEIARRNGACLYGSANACAIARACGLPERQIHLIQAGDEINIGELRVSVIAARHPWIPGYAPGRFDERLRPPLRLRDYRMDDCFSFLIHSQPSVLVWSSTSVRNTHPAQVLICRAVADAGWYRRLLATVEPGVVTPSHWDNLFQPLSHSPQPFLSPPRLAWPPVGKINLEEFSRRVRRARSASQALLPERFREYHLDDNFLQ